MTMSIAFALFSLANVAHAASCDPLAITSLDGAMVQDDTAGPVIPLGDMSFAGVEPDEIDLTSACLPDIHLGPVALTGVEPDEIDFALHSEGTLDIVFLDAGEPAPAGPVLVSSSAITLSSPGQVVVGHKGRSKDLVTTTGTVVLAPLDGFLSEQVDPTGAVTRSLDLSFEVVDVVPEANITVDAVYMTRGTGFEATDEIPVTCSGCGR